MHMESVQKYVISLSKEEVEGLSAEIGQIYHPDDFPMLAKLFDLIDEW